MSEHTAHPCCCCTTVLAWIFLVLAAAGWVVYTVADASAPISFPSLITASIASTLFLILLFARLFD